MPLWLCLWLPTSPRPEPEASAAPDEAALARILLHYTPQVARVHRDAWVLNLQSSLMLFGGVRPLLRSLGEDLSDHGPGLRLGLAPSALGARLLARSPGRRKRCLQFKTLHKLLDDLPLHVLDLQDGDQRWLRELGCLRCVDLRRLPRDGLAGRGLHTLLDKLDAAYLQGHAVFSWLPPPLEYRRRLELDHSLDQVAPLLHQAGFLLQDWSRWLQQRQMACGHLNLRLYPDRSREDALCLSLALSRSSWLPEDILPVLQERLRSLQLVRPIRRIELEALQLHARRPGPGVLFPDAGYWREQDQRLLELLQARLGTQNVRQPRLQAEHLPELANQWVSWDSQAPETGDTPLLQRPFWLLTPAPELHREPQGLRLGNRLLQRVQGPERIQTGWWRSDGHHQRDYFVAQDKDAVRYWIYRDLRQPERWFLQGIFG